MLILSVSLSVPCLHLEGKQKGLQIPNLVGRVPGTPAPRGPISRSRGQMSRSRRLIALIANCNFLYQEVYYLSMNLILLVFPSPNKQQTDLESPKTARTYSTASTAP